MKNRLQGCPMTEKSERYKKQPIEHMIMTIRGQRVILDADLARVYGVPTRRLNEQVRRNTDRFPPDFTFVLTGQEVANLKSQFATSSAGMNRSQFATGSTHGGAESNLWPLPSMAPLWRLLSSAASRPFR